MLGEKQNQGSKLGASISHDPVSGSLGVHPTPWKGTSHGQERVPLLQVPRETTGCKTGLWTPAPGAPRCPKILY